MKSGTFILFIMAVLFSCSQPDHDKQAIYDSMLQSQQAWNQGDFVGFMHNYTQSDSMKFIGKSGITYGYQPTLERYQKRYPDADARGILEYEFKHLDQIDRNHYFQVGKWMLFRKTDTLSGHFSLLWEKQKGEWKIIADHSS